MCKMCAKSHGIGTLSKIDVRKTSLKLCRHCSERREIDGSTFTMFGSRNVSYIRALFTPPPKKKGEEGPTIGFKDRRRRRGSGIGWGPRRRRGRRDGEGFMTPPSLLLLHASKQKCVGRQGGEE